MHNNFPKRENDPRGRRSEVNPVDEAANIPKAEIQAAVEPQKEEVKAAPASGVVVNCLKLNVREEPKTTGKVVTLISALTEVIIDMDASSDDFYKIATADGINGFCMKKYIALKR